MYEFMDRLINVRLPAQSATSAGVNPKSFDGKWQLQHGRQRKQFDLPPKSTRTKVNFHARHGHHLRDQHPKRRRSAWELLRGLRHAVSAK